VKIFIVLSTPPVRVVLSIMDLIAPSEELLAAWTAIQDRISSRSVQPMLLYEVTPCSGDNPLFTSLSI
jgi:hypothetical protein